MENENEKEEKLSSLKAILGDVGNERLIEILEASDGSLDHAISIYFDQKHQQVDINAKGGRSVENVAHRNSKQPPGEAETKYGDGISNSVKTKKRKPQKTCSRSNREGESTSTTKQSRLDSFFRVETSTNNGLGNGFPARSTTTDREVEIINGERKNVERCHPDSSKRLNTATCDSSKKIHNMTTNKPATPIKKSPTKNKITVSASGSVASKDDNCDQNNYTNPVSFSFARLAGTLQEMADTTKRLVKLKALETLIREIVSIDADVGPNDLPIRAHILASALELVLGGCITSKPLNVSGSAVSKALQNSSGITRNQISKAYRQYGDLGDCAASFFQKKTYFITISSNDHRRLSILQVTEGLNKIRETDGRDSKQHLILTLLRSCQSKSEYRFLVRLLIRNMRIGANIKTVLAALAMAIVSIGQSEDICDNPCNNTGNENNNRKKICPSSSPLLSVKGAITLVQKTYDVCPSIEKIIRALLEGGFDQMQRDCSIQVMTPIAPMLAHPIHSLDEIKDKMGDDDDHIIMEWKYDGMRCQAHYDGVDIKLFSRHMLDLTNQFLDVTGFLLEAMQRNRSDDNNSFIIDVEIVGVEGEGRHARLLPFQDLSTRRKMDDGSGVRVRVFAFDLMFLNGESLVNKPLCCRRAELHRSFKETIDFLFVSSQRLVSYDESKINSYLTEAIEGGAEGLMLKMLGEKSIFAEKVIEGVPSSSYEAGTRSHCWLKVKRDYVAGFADTIDVVPIGAWWGSGRKAQKSFLSPVLLAVYDDEEDVFRSICRCMSFTDAMYESIREFYFRGVPYPLTLNSQAVQGAGNNPQQNSTIVDIIHDRNGDDDGDDDDDDDDDDFNQHESDGLKNKEEDDQISQGEALVNEGNDNDTNRVNCFPNRPTSAFVITNETPPIWFRPMEVFEVTFADLSLSRQHSAAAGLVDEEGRGVALRFPRFKRRRPDKTPEQATTSVEIAQLFAKQSKIKIGSRLKDVSVERTKQSEASSCIK